LKHTYLEHIENVYLYQRKLYDRNNYLLVETGTQLVQMDWTKIYRRSNLVLVTNLS